MHIKNISLVLEIFKSLSSSKLTQLSQRKKAKQQQIENISLVSEILKQLSSSKLKQLSQRKKAAQIHIKKYRTCVRNTQVALKQ